MTGNPEEGTDQASVLLPAQEAAAQFLIRSCEIEGLRLTTTPGTLVLEGRVPSYSLKKLAVAEAARLFPVPRIVNRLRVVPHRHRRDTMLFQAVRAALAACYEAADRNVSVTAHHGVVVLQGTVCCSTCRSHVEAAVWALGGVADVANRLRVPRGPVSHHQPPAPLFGRAPRR